MVGDFEQYRKSCESGVHDYTKNGKCIGCGECCTNILPLSDTEIRTIKQYVKAHNLKPTVKAFISNTTIDLTCPFLDISKKCDKCNIYEVRPAICREFICHNYDKPELSAKLLDEPRHIIFMRYEFFLKE